MIATINTLPHFQHEVVMARLAWREERILSTVYHIARAEQLYIMLDDHDMKYLEEQDNELLDAFMELNMEIDELREREDPNI